MVKSTDTPVITDERFLDEILGQAASGEVSDGHLTFVANQMVPELRAIVEAGEDVDGKFLTYITNLATSPELPYVVGALVRMRQQGESILPKTYEDLLDLFVKNEKSAGTIKAIASVVSKLRDVMKDVDPANLQDEAVQTLIDRWVEVFEGDEEAVDHLEAGEIARLSADFATEIARIAMGSTRTASSASGKRRGRPPRNVVDSASRGEIKAQNFAQRVAAYEEALREVLRRISTRIDSPTQDGKLKITFADEKRAGLPLKAVLRFQPFALVEDPLGRSVEARMDDPQERQAVVEALRRLYPDMSTSEASSVFAHATASFRDKADSGSPKHWRKVLDLLND